jgi:hypothetical protein
VFKSRIFSNREFRAALNLLNFLERIILVEKHDGHILVAMWSRPDNWGNLVFKGEHQKVNVSEKWLIK